MNRELKQKILALYTEFKDVYGPYIRKNDNREIVILYDGQKRSARQLAKILLEVKLGRLLNINFETVDHKDGNCTNNSIDNLQILERGVNAKKEALHIIPILAKCIYCKKDFYLSVNQRNTENKAGPFCSKQCSGLYGKIIQMGGEKESRVIYEKKYVKGGLLCFLFLIPSTSFSFTYLLGNVTPKNPTATIWQCSNAAVSSCQWQFPDKIFFNGFGG